MQRTAKASEPQRPGACQQLAIVRMAGLWRLYRNGQDAGRFDYQVDAVEAGLRLAEKIRDAGLEAELLVQDRGGELERLTPAPPPVR